MAAPCVRVTERGKRAGIHQHMDAKGANPLDRDRVSPSASEPDSASLHQWSVANLPEKVKPAAVSEAMSIGT